MAARLVVDASAVTRPRAMLSKRYCGIQRPRRRWTVACRRCPPGRGAARLQRNAQAPPANERRDRSRLGAEYGAPILSIAQVAVWIRRWPHIARHGSRHTDVIVTRTQWPLPASWPRSTQPVCSTMPATAFRTDTVSVWAPRSGISTEKLHARGPVGVEGLLTYRWVLYGHGQVTTDYGPGGRHYIHKDLPVDGLARRYCDPASGCNFTSGSIS